MHGPGQPAVIVPGTLVTMKRVFTPEFINRHGLGLVVAIVDKRYSEDALVTVLWSGPWPIRRIELASMGWVEPACERVTTHS